MCVVTVLSLLWSKMSHIYTTFRVILDQYRSPVFRTGVLSFVQESLFGTGIKNRTKKITEASEMRMTRFAAAKSTVSAALSPPAEEAIIPDIESPPTQQNVALIGALRAACSIANVKFTEAMSANDILVELMAKRDPSIFPLSSEHNSIRQASIEGSVAAYTLKENHTFAGKDITSDPLLANLSNARRDPCALGSVRQAIPGTEYAASLDLVENAKLAAINIGDVVQYREPGSQDTVMAVVIRITVKRARGSGSVLRIQARRLYAYKELFGILDRIAPYRRAPNLKDVCFDGREQAAALREDDGFKSAQLKYSALKTLLKGYFSSADTGPQHSVLMTALSDYDVFLEPEAIYSVLHATMHPAIFEKIDAHPQADPDWPTRSSADRMLGGVTVMWKAFVNTKQWTLHRIMLSEENMLRQVLSYAARALYWAPRIVTRGMAGIFRRTLRARMRDFGRHDGAREQFSLFIPCSFAFFAHFLQATRQYDSSVLQEIEEPAVTWDYTRRAWTATWSSPGLLHIQLGSDWGNWALPGGRTIQVMGDVIMRYCHAQPDKVQFILTRVILAVDGGLEVVVDVPEDTEPAVQAGF